MSKNQVVIGWREMIELPDLGVQLKAKIDTGAKSSSLDVSEIRLEGEHVHFTVRVSRKLNRDIEVDLPIHRMAKVRSSNGISQERVVVLMKIVMGGVSKDVEVTLTSRKHMLHRMLLGREALKDDFLIDAGVDHQTT